MENRLSGKTELLFKKVMTGKVRRSFNFFQPSLVPPAREVCTLPSKREKTVFLKEVMLMEKLTVGKDLLT